MGVGLIGIDVDGVRQWRAYSLTHGPRRDGCISVTVKAVPDGTVSPHLVHRTRPGTLVHLEQATGDFVLAEDAVLYSDGGGKRTAALNPIIGRDKIIRFASGRRAKEFVPLAVERVRINGQPGFVLRQTDGPETMAFEIANGVITAIYDVRNPDKLAHLNRA